MATQDNTTCKQCGHYNAMLFDRMDSFGNILLTCRNCGAPEVVPAKEEVPEAASPKKQRVVVSIYGGCVSGVYADGEAVEVLIVDEDNIARSLGEDREATGAVRASIDRITQMGPYVRNAVAIFDDESATCAACGDEFDVAENADFPNLGYEFCSTVCHDRHWRL